MSRKIATLWRRAWKVAAAIAVAYLAVCVGFYLLQDRRLFPGRPTQGQPHAVLAPSPEYELVRFSTSDGDPIVAIFGRAQDEIGRERADAPSRPTMLYFYGNSTCLADSLADFRRFRSLGLNVMIVDYPGYGMSGGRASERSLYACADATYDYLCHRPDVDRAQIIAAGWSLGAAVATDLAARKPVMCLATFSGFTSWAEETHDHFPWLPTSLLLDSRFDSESKFSQLRCPAFVAHGHHDRVVPFSMSHRLAAAHQGTVLIEVDSDHADIFQAGGTDLTNALSRFIEAAADESRAGGGTGNGTRSDLLPKNK